MTRKQPRRWASRVLSRALRGATLQLVFFGVALLLTVSGFITWDSEDELVRGRWYLASILPYGVLPVHEPPNIDFIRWYGNLWEFFLAVTELALSFVRDPMWIRNALTLTLYPWTLIATFALLRRAGTSRSTAAVAVALLVGLIRFGGHALLNTKDFPFACVFLLTTLYLWIGLRDAAKKAPNPWRLLSLTFVSLAPYLIRPPVLLHFYVLILGLLLLACSREARSWGPARRILASLLPIAYGAIIIALLYPPAWQGWENWLRSFGMFSKFPWSGHVRVFGITRAGTDLPGWYPFAWIPISFHPFALLGIVAGISGLAFREGRKGPDASITLGSVRLPMPLWLWLALITIVAWLGLLIARPVLYDEERHILFLLAPLALLGALGLEATWKRLPSHAPWYSVAVLLVASLVSFVTWTRFSYVYKSPIIGDISPSRFMGDYWGSCLNPMFRLLDKHVPKGGVLYIPGPVRSAGWIQKRLRDSLAVGDPSYGPYHIDWRVPAQRPYFAIVIQRVGTIEPFLSDLVEGRARLLETVPMPGDEPACLLVSYPAS